MTVYGKEFAAIYNVRWAFYTQRLWPFLQRQVRRHCGGARTWLDLCCGTGNLLKQVCKAGFEATGLDRSPHQLRVARGNATKAKLVRGDVRSLRLPGQFDIITSMMDSLNYVTSPADLLRVFRGVRRSLSDDGLFIFDVNTYDGLKRHWNSQSSASNEPGSVMIFETAFETRSGIGTLDVTGFARHGRRWVHFRERHIERGYREAQIRSMLKQAGFTVLLRCDEFFRRRAVRPSRLIFVCRKKVRSN